MTEDYSIRWNQRYRERPDRFGRAPALLLTRLAGDVVAGRAVEFGCGEGRNCQYLVEQGWEVLGLDFSDVAIGHAAANVRAGTFVCADVTSGGVVEPGSFDLGCAIYLHTSPEERMRWFPELIRAVRPGGHVIYVGHGAGEVEQPERPAPKALVRAELRKVAEVRVPHDHGTEPGHRATEDFGILWQRN